MKSPMKKTRAKSYFDKVIAEYPEFNFRATGHVAVAVHDK